MNPAGHDPARSLLTLAVRGLPPERQDWGQAMLAELDQLQDRWAQWRFALASAFHEVAGGRGLVVKVPS